MAKNESIKNFVRQKLGCKCPDHVFEQIDDRFVTLEISPHTRTITIGGKLLLYVWEVGSHDQLQEGIPAILSAGKRERDERGLNRFRTILVTGDPSAIKTHAQFCFSQFRNLDEKMHLHVVSHQDLTEIL